MVGTLAPVGLPLAVAALAGYAVRLRAAPRSREAAVGLVLAVILTAANASWQAPLYVGGSAHGPVSLTVVEMNLAHGEADPRRVVQLVAEGGADLAVLPEATKEEVERLDERGVQTTLPFRSGWTAPYRFGLTLLSRYRLSDMQLIAGASGAFTVRVDAPRPFTLVVVHAAQPLLHGATWAHDLAAVASTIRRTHGPLVAVGDFNATRDHVQLRRVLDAGVRDAAEEVGAGWQPTWPGATGVPVLRLFGLGALDHVLVNPDFGVVSTHTTKVSGTDHRMLTVRLTDR